MTNILTSFPEDKKAKTMIGSSAVFLNVSKKILARQSIFRNIDCNITHDLKRGPSFLTEEQFKMSSIYQKLVQRIQKIKTKQEEEIKQHQKAMQRMASEIKYLKASVQEDKVEMWQVKNQIIELQQILEEQMEEYNALCEEIRAQQEDEDEFDEEQGEDNENNFQNQQSYSNPSQTSSGSYELQTTKSQEAQQVSKPSCSIKYFISNRTITSPGFYKQNLQVGSGINFHSQQDNSKNYEQLLEKQNLQQSSTQHNLLSFKKSEKFFCQESL